MIFDGRVILVPQNDVQSVEVIVDLQKTNEIGMIGWFFEHELESPVFCLAEDFSLLSELPKKREYFVLLKNEQQPMGITCDLVENINLKQVSRFEFFEEKLKPRKHFQLQELPFVMKTPDSPIRQLLIYQEKIACVCDGPALVKHLYSALEQIEHS
jgi:hypothetical protein